LFLQRCGERGREVLRGCVLIQKGELRGIEYGCEKEAERAAKSYVLAAGVKVCKDSAVGIKIKCILQEILEKG